MCPSNGQGHIPACSIFLGPHKKYEKAVMLCPSVFNLHSPIKKVSVAHALNFSAYFSTLRWRLRFSKLPCYEQDTNINDNALCSNSVEALEIVKHCTTILKAGDKILASVVSYLFDVLL